MMKIKSPKIKIFGDLNLKTLAFSVCYNILTMDLLM